MQNTEHDEELNRRAWEPTADCLGGTFVDSTRAPQHGEPRKIIGGTYGERNRRTASTSGKGTYR